MNLFKRSKKAPSGEATKARVEADQEHETAVAQYWQARRLAEAMAEIRAHNHFAESLRHAFRGDT